MRTANVSAYEALHAERAYGTTAVRMRRFIEPWVRLARPASVLDYGAGQGRFVDVIDVPTLCVRARYDPAIAEIATPPAGPFDYLLCIDVLEHLEPDEVRPVLTHMRSLSERALVVITTKPARATLPDGRNAHTTLRPARWWRQEVAAVFGTAVAVPVLRRGRCGFKTYRSPSRHWLAFWQALARAEMERRRRPEA